MIGRNVNFNLSQNRRRGVVAGMTHRRNLSGAILPAADEGWRLKGGWSSWEAGVFNAGTSPSDAKRKVTSGRTARTKVSMCTVRGGVTRSSVESRGNPEGAKGWPPLRWITAINKVNPLIYLGGIAA